MIPHFRLLTFLFAMVLSVQVRSQPTPSSMQEAEARGTGTTEEEAFKQALLDAVRQAVGTLVSAENLVKNDKVFKDEILTFSNGFVEKVSKQERRRLGDLWEVRLNCSVRKGQLQDTLQLAKIPTLQTVPIDGTSIAAKLASELERKRKAEFLVIDCLDRFLVDYLSCYETKSADPELETPSAGMYVSLVFPVSATFNKSSWNRASSNLLTALAAAELLSISTVTNDNFSPEYREDREKRIFKSTSTLEDTLTKLDRRFEVRPFQLFSLGIIDLNDNAKMSIYNYIDTNDAPSGWKAFLLCVSGNKVEFIKPFDEEMFSDGKPYRTKMRITIPRPMVPNIKSAAFSLAYCFDFDKISACKRDLSGSSPFYLKRIASGPFVKTTSEREMASFCTLLEGLPSFPWSADYDDPVWNKFKNDHYFRIGAR